MALDAGNGDQIQIRLKTGSHGPQDILQVKAVHILIHQKDMLQLGKSGEGQQGRLSLPPLIRGNRF